MRRAILALLICGVAVPVTAAPQVYERLHTYDVTATDIDGIRAQMADRGPRGYWGYASWFVNWDRDCNVTLTLDLTLPRHSRPDALSPQVRAIWDDMLRALDAHERQHLDHGINAAREIEAADCRGGFRILRRWSAMDAALDARTEHGRLDGVDLK